MNTLDAVDESWGRISPAAAKAAGIKVVMGYLSTDSSKNLTAADIRAYHAAGIGVVLGWESVPGRPLLGAAAGTADARASVAQIRALYAAVGYQPKNRPANPFACDTDTSVAQLGAVLAYQRAAQKVMSGIGWDAGMYGEFAVIEYLAAHGVKRGLFQTLAWSGGQFSTHTALYQWSINRTLGGTSVDFDQLIDPSALGAWWPPGHALDAAVTEGTSLVAELSTDQVVAQIADAVYAKMHKGAGGDSHSLGGLAQKAEAAAVSAASIAGDVQKALADEEAGVLAQLAAMQKRVSALTTAVDKLTKASPAPVILPGSINVSGSLNVASQ